MKRALQSWMWLDFVYAVTARGTKFAKVTRRMHRFTTKVVVERQQADAARRGPAHTEESERDSSDLGDPAAEEMAAPDATENKRPAFLDLLSDYCRQGIFTVEDGQDTSAQTLTWTLFALAIHPDIQRNVHGELDKVFKPDSGNSVTKRDVANLPYLDRVLKASTQFQKAARATCSCTAYTGTRPITGTPRSSIRIASCVGRAAAATRSPTCPFRLALGIA
ncbi:hypothetical protein HPB48_007561 [Haemaphysalis longicornis]|uniref:Cytochrome P450 n=1 Tax=Haemaphysalis longicornis TaxID=44386 RepID=A0A9J6FC74_HAELO|nr:hypothetical protein HPB48_007561 [Haemaphysalis longicornis]